MNLTALKVLIDAYGLKVGLVALGAFVLIRLIPVLKSMVAKGYAFTITIGPRGD